MRGFTIEILLTGIPNAFAKCQKNSKNVNLGLNIEFLGRLGSIFSKKLQRKRSRQENMRSYQRSS